MDFEEFRQQQIAKGKIPPLRDAWDIVRPPMKCDKPDLVKYEGRVYQVVERKKGKIRIVPICGKAESKIVSATSTRLKK